MERQVIFVKRFSDISALQVVYKFTYLILWSESGTPYGLAIERTGQGEAYEECATHLFDKRDEAEAFALFLY